MTICTDCGWESDNGLALHSCVGILKYKLEQAEAEREAMRLAKIKQQHLVGELREKLATALEMSAARSKELVHLSEKLAECERDAYDAEFAAAFARKDNT